MFDDNLTRLGTIQGALVLDYIPIDTAAARALVIRSRHVLGLTQAALGRRLGCSGRTVLRWENRQGTPSPRQIAALAEAIVPVDASLAEDLCALLETTPEALGLVPPAPDAPSSPALAALGPDAMTRFLADSVVCAAAEVASLPPAVLRPALVAALTRMTQLSFPPDALLAALAPPPPPEPAAEK